MSGFEKFSLFLGSVLIVSLTVSFIAYRSAPSPSVRATNDVVNSNVHGTGLIRIVDERVGVVCYVYTGIDQLVCMPCEENGLSCVYP